MSLINVELLYFLFQLRSLEFSGLSYRSMVASLQVVFS